MEPTLPSFPLPLDTEGLMTAGEQALDFISFVARNDPPDAAAAEIPRAATLLIEIIAKDYEATAREDAELEDGPGASPERTYFESLSPAKQDIFLELVGTTRAAFEEFRKNRLQPAIVRGHP